MTRELLAASLLALVPLAASAQSDGESRCRNELASRGYAGYAIERVTVRESLVTGLMRSGNEVLEFQCDVTGLGVTEVRVDRARGGYSPEPRAAEYQRGYSDGYRRMPYNNYRHNGEYEQGYDDGYRDGRRR